MRILATTWSSRRVGGAETYLGRIMALLSALGHDIGFCFEVDEPVARTPILLPPNAAVFRLGASAPSAAIAPVRAWAPDVIYAHGLLDAQLEAELLEVAPAVFFAHSYYGTCISGDKTHKFPVVRPCTRVFGPACLGLYFPRRCGGASPITMMREYSRQRARLSLLARYDAVMTHSTHMREEFLRHNAAGGRVFSCSYGIGDENGLAAPLPVREPRSASAPWHLMFVGRMDRLKGGRELLDALPRARAGVGRPLRLTFAGDGPERHEWERHAAIVTRRVPDVTVTFAGWQQHTSLVPMLDSSDAVVVPSLWPEPYGLVGPEANRRGVPVVAFATGGIPEWLVEGVNGCLAPGDPPSIDGLSDAIVRCLRSLESSDTLRKGALAAAGSMPDDVHVRGLVEILTGAVARRRALSAARA